MADFASEVVAEVFAYEAEEIRECLQADLADLGPEETARQFEKAETILSGLLRSFEDDVCLLMVLSRAKQMATEARRLSEAYPAAKA